MSQSKLEYLNSWLEHYSNDFLSGDPKIDTNIQFKIDHTYRVRDNILAIAASLNLNPNNMRIAEVIGLLHDIGRFEQFVKYSTFRDDISEDHAELGLKVLATNHVLSELSDEEKDIVETAIRYHNKYLLPQLILGDCLMFCKLIRDADKLDIFEQLVNEVFEDFPDKDEYSPEVVESILEGRVVSYTNVKTSGDIKLMRMSWVLDINYGLTLKKILDKEYLERMVAKFPQTEDIQQVYGYLKSYIERSLNLDKKSQYPYGRSLI